ncbi:hypothetical protein MCEMSEM23_00618 [Rhabdaerophilaceae bacterium]
MLVIGFTAHIEDMQTPVNRVTLIPGRQFCTAAICVLPRLSGGTNLVSQLVVNLNATNVIPGCRT